MLLVGALLAPPAGAAGGDLVWADRLGSTSNDSAFGVAVDGSGNVYVTGSFSETVDFDPGTGVFPLTPAGVNDGFVMKLDAAGGFLWAIHLGGTSFDSGRGVAVDGSGNVYVTGSFSETADFDPGTGVSELTSAGSADGFVVKLDATGEFLWADRLGDTSDDSGIAVAVDGSGNVYATGYFQGTVDFDPGTGVSELTSAGFVDGFVVKLDATTGGLVWAGRLGGTSGDAGSGVAVDGSGNVYATGYFHSTADFDPDPVDTFNLVAAGSADGFVLKLDATGGFLWADRLGGNTGFDEGIGVAVDGSGNVYATGYFQGTVDFDPGTGVSELTSAGTDDVFVVKLDTAGGLVWADRLGGTLSDRGAGVAVDGSGNVYATGRFMGTADFDPDPVDTVDLVSAGDTDVFVVKLDAAGGFLWADRLGGTLSDEVYGVAVDGSGNVHATGRFRGTADFDPGTGVSELTSAGETDGFVVKLGDITDPVVTPPSDVAVEADGPDGSIVTYPAANATDDVGVVSGPTCVPPSGSLFPIGLTTVTCSASDAAGNVGEATFTVTVQDTTDPMVTPPANVVVNADGPDGSIVTYPAAVATDAVGVTSGPSCVPSSGSLFPPGVTTVTCTASDAAGNTGSDTFGVTVTEVVRLAGGNRFGTAAAISLGDFPNPASVSTVFVAVGTNFPDALAGAAVAGKLGAPLLLVNVASIPAETAEELTRLSPETIVILGGTGVISPGVESALDGYATTVVRLAGANRYATAVAISQYGFPATANQVVIATGTGFADALAGGPAAVALGGPVLLTDPNGLLPVVADEISRLNPSRIVVVGGTGAVSATVFDQLKAIQVNTVRIAGASRYDTAVAISQDAFSSGATRAYVATGLNFPDALAGAGAAGWWDAPMLLVPGSSLPASVSAEITRLGAIKVVILGGTAVVTTTVETALNTLLAN